MKVFPLVFKTLISITIIVSKHFKQSSKWTSSSLPHQLWWSLPSKLIKPLTISDLNLVRPFKWTLVETCWKSKSNLTKNPHNKSSPLSLILKPHRKPKRSTVKDMKFSYQEKEEKCNIMTNILYWQWYNIIIVKETAHCTLNNQSGIHYSN